MKWQDLLPKGWENRGDRYAWTALEHWQADGVHRFVQCGGLVNDAIGNAPSIGRLVVGTDPLHDECERPFDAVIPEGTPLGQAVREIVTNPEGWPALLDLLLDDPEAGPHVRRLLEETS